MSERLERIRELEQQVVAREKRVDGVARRVGLPAGRGAVTTCEHCQRRYMVMVQTDDPPACPYCGR